MPQIFFISRKLACQKNLSLYKPALNYPNIYPVCLTLTGNLSVLSRSEFWAITAPVSVRLGQFFPRKVRVQSRYARRFLLFALLSSPDRAPAANSAWTPFSHALRADNSKQRSVWPAHTNVTLLPLNRCSKRKPCLSARLWSRTPICINHRLSSQLLMCFSVKSFGDLDLLFGSSERKIATNQHFTWSVYCASDHS